MNKLLLSLLCLISVNVPFIKINKVETVYTTVVESDTIIKNAKSAILIDASTGNVLYEKNANEKLSPASMTKIMTMKLVLDSIDNNELSFDEILTTSKHASSMGGSQVFLSVGEKMKCVDLFKSMVIASANDAAVVLAEKVSGSEDNFVRKMNLEASKIGCKNTNFINCTGLPENNHYTTCYDMALIAKSLLNNYEDTIIPFTKTYEDYIRTDTEKPFWLVNTNKMIKMNNGIDGLKTGWTNEAGYCITTTMKKGDMRLICVIMNAETPTLRNNDALSLLNYGFDNYEIIKLKDKDDEILCESDVMLYPSKYHIVTSKPVYYLKNKDIKLGEVKYEVKLDRSKIRNLCTLDVGVLNVYIDDKLYTSVSLKISEKTTKSKYNDVIYQIFISLFK